MKTLLFSPLYVDSLIRLERNKQWLEYMQTVKPLQWDELLYIDNSSPALTEFQRMLQESGLKATIERHSTHIPRYNHLAYGYWYYAFGQAVKYAKANGFDRLLHVDTDFYILSNRFCTYLNNIDTGWQSPWCARHNFPESTLQVICKDQFDAAEKFYTRDFLAFYPFKPAEEQIPYTKVFKQFTGDRYGEIQGKLQEPGMDYYAQKENHVKLVFDAKD